jgi:hypothetical protein
VGARIACLCSKIECHSALCASLMCCTFRSLRSCSSSELNREIVQPLLFGRIPGILFLDQQPQFLVFLLNELLVLNFCYNGSALKTNGFHVLCFCVSKISSTKIFSVSGRSSSPSPS